MLGVGFDLGHLFWAGMDLPDMMRRHRDRIAALHLKDLDTARVAKLQAEPLPYIEVDGADRVPRTRPRRLPLLESLDQPPDDFDGWIIVEVDKPSMESLASARTSWTWIEDHFPALVLSP